VSGLDFGRFEKKHSGYFSHCGVFTQPGSKPAFQLGYQASDLHHKVIV
jgi:hypothetical protein